MNSQRKTYALFCIFFGLFIMHINAMESHQPIIVISQENSSTQNLFLFGTGFALGAGCVGLACWYNHQKKFNALENKFEKIQEEHQVLKKRIDSQKELQEEETTRLDQVRAWVIDDKKKYIDQRIKTAINNVEQLQEIKELKNRIAELETQEKFYSCHSS